MKKESGFTLIELAIVMVIIGLIMVPAMQYYAIYMKNKRDRVTREHIEKVTKAINNFPSFSLEGRYPLPSDITLAPGDVNYGKEVTSATTLALGTCGNGVCRIKAEDYTGTAIDRDGGDIDGDSVNDAILIGGIPDTTMRELMRKTDLSINDTYDGYGRKLTYAVTENLANPSITDGVGFNAEYGVISVSKDKLKHSLVKPEHHVHFLVFGHGEDGLGAYTRNGKLYKSCQYSSIVPPGSPPGTVANPKPSVGTMKADTENCDGDSEFISTVISESDGDSHFDDTLVYEIMERTEQWGFAERPDGSGVKDMYNLNKGNVGVGTMNPLEKLHIGDNAGGDGNVRIVPEHPGDAVGAEAKKFCDKNGNNCFDASMIGGCKDDGSGNCVSGEYYEVYDNTAGEGVGCPDGQVMRGIKDGKAVCVTEPSGSWNGQGCPAGERIIGFKTDGSVICSGM